MRLLCIGINVWCSEVVEWAKIVYAFHVSYTRLPFVLLFFHDIPGPLFTKWTDVLPQDLVMSRSREIRVSAFPFALKSDRHISSSAAEMAVKLQSDKSLQHPISRLRDFTRFGLYRSVNRGPDYFIGTGYSPKINQVSIEQPWQIWLNWSSTC